MLIAAPFVFAQKKKTTTKKKTKPKTEKQDKKTLQARKENLQADIDLTDKLLKQTRRTKTLSLSQLVALNKKIEAREALIGEINTEISDLDAQITEQSNEVVRLDSEIAELKRNYARMIVFAYKNRNPYDRMMFVFSAENFNQAFLRMRYMAQIGRERQLKADDLAAKQQEHNENIRSLEDQKAEKQSLLGSQETEKQQLAVEKDEKDKTFRDLQTKEQQLKADLDKKKKEKANIDAAIQKIIDDELAAQLKANAPKTTAPKSGSTGNKTTPKPGEKPASGGTAPPKLTLTPEAENLGNSFAANQGALPWPVVQGTITGHFGKQPHPVLKDVYVNNNGIDIATPSGAAARAVFDGEVTGVTNIPGSGWLVIVRHGEYLTVYAKLESVSVKKGDKVKTKQTLGQVATDADEGQSILHFEVWKSGLGKMDPEQWLLKGAR